MFSKSVIPQLCNQTEKLPTGRKAKWPEWQPARWSSNDRMQGSGCRDAGTLTWGSSEERELASAGARGAGGLQVSVEGQGVQSAELGLRLPWSRCCCCWEEWVVSAGGPRRLRGKNGLHPSGNGEAGRGGIGINIQPGTVEQADKESLLVDVDGLQDVLWRQNLGVFLSKNNGIQFLGFNSAVLDIASRRHFLGLIFWLYWG